MKYTVLWQPRAEQTLASIWLHADDRDTVTRAAAEIDADLRSRPLDVGESRTKSSRVLFSGPLGVAYSVAPDDAVVRVLRVWKVKRRHH